MVAKLGVYSNENIDGFSDLYIILCFLDNDGLC